MNPAADFCRYTSGVLAFFYTWALLLSFFYTWDLLQTFFTWVLLLAFFYTWALLLTFFTNGLLSLIRLSITRRCTNTLEHIGFIYSQCHNLPLLIRQRSKWAGDLDEWEKQISDCYAGVVQVGNLKISGYGNCDEHEDLVLLNYPCHSATPLSLRHFVTPLLFHLATLSLLPPPQFQPSCLGYQPY